LRGKAHLSLTVTKFRNEAFKADIWFRMAQRLILLIFFLFGLFPLAYGQAVPSKKENSQEKKEIKNVPSAEAKPKPAKISSSARPNNAAKGAQPAQPAQRAQPGKATPSRGKPPGVGKPPGN
jgi:hypothetical protein